MSSQGETSPCSDLREACVREALAIITSAGVEKLSLREVARRLGVSHQSPYRHFESRDHVLAEIVRRAFVDLLQPCAVRRSRTIPAQMRYRWGSPMFALHSRSRFSTG